MYLCDPSLLWLATAKMQIFPIPAHNYASPSGVDAVLLPFVVEALLIQFLGPFVRELFHMWL